ALAGGAALYRSLVAGKPVLLMLDDARVAGQARPLLPGAPGCLAVVTSRDQLTSPARLEGARPLVLDVLSAGAARELLARRLGQGRTAGEPDAVDQIISRCSRLPLALALVAARTAACTELPLAAVAEELSTAGRTLEPFPDADPGRHMRT